MVAVFATAALLIYGTRDMPEFGDRFSPANRHADVARRYLDGTRKDMGKDMPNVVTAVLAHYRGYDTMGETTVIFVAAMVVVLLLRPLRRDYGPEARTHLPESEPAETRMIEKPSGDDAEPPEREVSGP